MRIHLGCTVAWALATLHCSGGGGAAAGNATPSDDGGPVSTGAEGGAPDSAAAPDVDQGQRPSDAGIDAALSRDAAASRDAATVQDAGLTEYDQVAPTPPATWVSVTNNLAGLASECGNMGGVYPDPHEDLLIAGVALHGLWASTDGAQTWTAIGAGGDKIQNRPTSVVYDPSRTDTFWESGIYGWETGTDGVFITANRGSSFTGYGALATAQNGGNTNDSIAVDFSDPQRKTLLAGSHETPQAVYLSTNGGSAWTNVGAALPATLGFCTTTMVVDAGTLLVGCAASWSGKAGAIMRSTTAGASWTQVHASGVVGQPLLASDGSIYWAAEGGGMNKSTDRGQTWSQVADANTAGTLQPLELPDGRIVSTEQQNIVISADHGMTWKTIGSPMPYAPTGFSYSPFRSAFYIWYFTCTGANSVPSDAIMRFGWNYR